MGQLLYKKRKANHPGKVGRKPKARTEYALERIVKGFANHRRIEIVRLLERTPELSVDEIAEHLSVNIKTVSQHIQRLASAGIIMKRSDGTFVRHKLTFRGKDILEFLRIIE